MLLFHTGRHSVYVLLIAFNKRVGSAENINMASRRRGITPITELSRFSSVDRKIYGVDVSV